MAGELNKGKSMDVTMTQRLKTYVDKNGQPNDYYEYTVDINGEQVVFYPTKESKDLVLFLFKQNGKTD